jgi:hypothetical protein
MDRTIFFNNVRQYPFPNRLTDTQVKGMEAILDAWEQRADLTDLRWLAYMFGTTFHETAFTMQPIREYGRGKGMRYGTTYYGRGYVQLTWKDNYQKMGELLKVDMVANPDLALELDIAAKVMFHGMEKGMFRADGQGKPYNLPRYFHDESDWYNARNIINGKLDCTTKISEYARAFWYALISASRPQGESPRSLEQQRRQISDMGEQKGDAMEPVDLELMEVFREFNYMYHEF